MERPARETYERQCHVCGRTFTATRQDAHICSATCRSKKLRAERGPRHFRLEVEEQVIALINRTHETGDHDDLGALKRLRRLIDEAITTAQLT